MKYLRLFENNSAATAALNLVNPNVTLIEEGQKLLNIDCGAEKPLEIKIEGGEPVIIEKSTGPEMVDLGLPSGTLWAKCNIGAASETAAGKYFAWGDAEGFEASEASGKFSSTWYNNRPGKSLSGNIADNDATHNAAFKAYGAGYTMPSQADFNELITGTNHSWTKVGGVNGHKFTNKSDATKYIFIPAAGCGNDGSISNVGNIGSVWSSSYYSANRAYYLYFSYNGNIYVTDNYRFLGYSVRAIKRNN